MALLISACGFTEPRKFVIINENCDTDGSFLISSLIGQRLRQQSSAIVLICCHQSLKFYETCGKKLGYNLIMSLNKKSLVVIEKLRDVPLMTSDPDNLMEQLYGEINNHVNTFKSNGIKNISVIIDDLTFFTNLGCTEKELIKISMKLHKLTKEYNELSVILKVGLSDLHQYLTNNIEDLSDVSITVEKLKSGDFWDVDGKLRIKKVKCENGIYMTESERNILYYVGDHNVKIIAPGEHGLKI
ncbi:uncharacterized protein [Chironomus tepperi]|uniref:uncharacterized protein n=1 Tax=Chironomus tepperi TaxID=113505 RepID=UPI00391F4E60